jgi:hypothetical protein
LISHVRREAEKPTLPYTQNSSLRSSILRKADGLLRAKVKGLVEDSRRYFGEATKCRLSKLFALLRQAEP